MSKMKRRLKIILGSTLILFFGLFILSAGVYVYYPQTFYRGITRVTLKVLPSKSYETEYGVHPYLHTKIEKVLEEARAEGIDLRIVEGFRDPETQQKYYDQGRINKGGIITYAPPGLSYHNHGWAVDVCEYVNGQPKWDSEHWDRIGAIGKKHGLVWGGDWKRLVDKPHFQLTNYDIIRRVVF